MNHIEQKRHQISKPVSLRHPSVFPIEISTDLSKDRSSYLANLKSPAVVFNLAVKAKNLFDIVALSPAGDPERGSKIRTLLPYVQVLTKEKQGLLVEMLINIVDEVDYAETMFQVSQSVGEFHQGPRKALADNALGQIFLSIASAPSDLGGIASAEVLNRLYDTVTRMFMDGHMDEMSADAYEELRNMPELQSNFKAAEERYTRLIEQEEPLNSMPSLSAFQPLR
ncbi:hypothetical protein ACCS93_38010 [Rhizobium ruizarguesonis]